MLKKITTSTATYPIGQPPATKLFRLASGQYQNRQVVLIQTAAADIKLSWADPPYVSWSALQTIASAAADQPFAAVMEPDGDIHIVYTNSSNDLAARKLSFASGAWTVGSEVTVYSPYSSYFPALALQSNGTLWVAWSRLDGSDYYLQVKTSTDAGSTWGSGSTDGGDSLTTAVSALFSSLVIAGNSIYAIYTYDDDTLAVRSHALSGGSWSAVTDLATASGRMDQNFAAAASESGLVGVTWDQDTLKFREYDGDSWGSVVTLDAAATTWPQLRYVSNTPVVTYLSAITSDQVAMKVTDRRTGSFSTPVSVDDAADYFDAIQLYNLGSFIWADLTTEATSATTADVYHPDSSVLLKNPGDCICLGMDVPFRYVRFLLSTAGSGGTINYSYWDGRGWIAFVPDGGAYHLDQTDRGLLLWEDGHAIPDDWQKEAVGDSDERFWVKLQVISTFSVGPVGSRLTALGNLKAMTVRR